MASTRMAGPPDLMSLEHHFNTHLEDEHVVTLDDEQLTLGREDHEIVLTRAPVVE